ncbi:tetratricopeptide repeat-containing sensor histidine kinase [Natronoflexus pectinivorans]|uniref:histidine kinase n=1 Tax=Natronoflexus pectinivorans TaxID=682526 RepID=A0A4V2RWV5_9BACT|nr:HAMP domain-containing sensor histidine kinase [Natronoflexus pectinivorans]TCO10391.1 signal transduction histidine kinase [Natronoflexus pectinivorans]
MFRQPIILAMFLSLTFICYGRNRVAVDSCLQILNSQTNLSIDEQSRLILKIIQNSDYEDPFFDYTSQLREIAEKSGDTYYLFYSWYEEGQALINKGSYEDATSHLIKSLEIARENNLIEETGLAKYALSVVFYTTNNHEAAIRYIKDAINIYSKLDQSHHFLGGSYYQLGNIYLVLKEPDSALYNYHLASQHFDPDIAPHAFAYIQGNIGTIHFQQNRTDSARANLNKAISILSELNDYLALVPLLIYNSQNEIISGNNQKALKLANDAMKHARVAKSAERKRDAYKNMAKIYFENHDFQNAYMNLIRYMHLSDSIINLETITEMANLRTDYEIGLKQAEVDQLIVTNRYASRIILLVTFTLILVTFFLFVIWRQNRQKNLLNLELRQKADELIINKRELEISNQSKDKLFSILAHDLRGPVGAITSLSRYLLEALNNNNMKDAKEIAFSMSDASKQVTFLLNNLLHWSISQQNIYLPVKKPLNMTDLVTHIIQLYKPTAIEKDIEITYSSPYFEIIAETDTNCWATIIRNLLNNAIKFTEKGGTINISLNHHSGKLWLEVKDSGIGMTKSQIDSLFKPDSIKSSWGTMNEKGQGLGLILVHDFVTINKGTIEVDSKPNHGTVFVVAIPADLLKKGENSEIITNVKK